MIHIKLSIKYVSIAYQIFTSIPQPHRRNFSCVTKWLRHKCSKDSPSAPCTTVTKIIDVITILDENYLRLLFGFSVVCFVDRRLFLCTPPLGQRTRCPASSRKQLPPSWLGLRRRRSTLMRTAIRCCRRKERLLTTCRRLVHNRSDNHERCRYFRVPSRPAATIER